MSNLHQKMPVIVGLLARFVDLSMLDFYHTHTYSLWVRQITPLQTCKPTQQLPNQDCLHPFYPEAALLLVY